MLIAFVNITESVNDLEEKVKDLQRELESLRLRKQPFTIRNIIQDPDKVCYTSVFHRFKLTVLYMFFFLKKKDNVSSCWFCKSYIYIVVLKD